MGSKLYLWEVKSKLNHTGLLGFQLEHQSAEQAHFSAGNFPSARRPHVAPAAPYPPPPRPGLGPGRTHISVTLSPSALCCGTGKEMMPGAGSAHQIRQELQRQDAGQPSAPHQEPSTRQHKPHSRAKPGPGRLRRQDAMPPLLTPALPRSPPPTTAAGEHDRRVRSLRNRGRALRGRGSHGRTAAAREALRGCGTRRCCGTETERGDERRERPPARHGVTWPALVPALAPRAGSGAA